MFQKIVLGLALAAAIPAQAAVTVSVAGTAMPWLWDGSSLNVGYEYGVLDGTGPTVVTLASAGITPGGSWGIFAKGGLTSASGGTPTVDHNGYVGSVFKDDDPGSSGNYFPSHYMSYQWDTDPGAGVFLNALSWAFTDSAGQIQQTPDAMNVFYISPGNYGYVFGKSSSGLSASITQVQFGLNDDVFSDNTGSLDVCVGDSFEACFPTAPVPEPASWALMIGGFALTGLALRRRRPGWATA